MSGILGKMRKFGSSDMEESETTDDHTDGEDSAAGTPNSTYKATKHSIFSRRARFGIGDCDKDMAPMDSFYHIEHLESNPIIKFSLSLERGRCENHCPNYLQGKGGFMYDTCRSIFDQIINYASDTNL